MAESEVSGKVFQLKELLNETTESKKISVHTFYVLKTLMRLQDLKITLDILAETGIGKTVNGFRKHEIAGDVAKALVNQWKKLVPKETSSSSLVQDDHTPEKQESAKKKKRFSKRFPTGKKAPNHVDKEKYDHKRNKESPSFNSITEKTYSSAKSLIKKSTKVTNGDHVKCDGKSTRSTEKRSSTSVKLEMDNKKAKLTKSIKSVEFMDVKDKSGDSDFGEPTMSFETYLNYDLAPASKKRKKPSEIQKLTKKHKKHDSKAESLGKKVSEKEQITTEKKELKSEDSPKKMKSGSIMDLLNVPLPSFLPDCFLFPSPCIEKKKQAEVPNTSFEDATGFTGQRLNSKMQVYSGAKTVVLPVMMTLYQQCIRALQNNIDSLYEIGGVPFEILEPVLEHCTPEQLYRIEEYNPAYIGDTDHLWIKHCQKEFKHERPQEYEAWREMYLRLFEERENKFKLLSKSIASAHSGKPKGRQVKRAFIHTVVKPPRDVRRKQEIYRTAGPTAQPHSVDKMNVKAPESKARLCSSDVRMCTSSAGPSQDPKKMAKKIAPMMAKSLKIFKSRLVRR
ncbi:elongin-A-like [Acipenser ruthenus]|uniref:elongin-A-like n=1 Tax=Acipenser ruthenus TaxID=7906 RepID=UPI002741BA68|nr:elongin-A-like [Acipenser ruthenus]